MNGFARALVLTGTEINDTQKWPIPVIFLLYRVFEVAVIAPWCILDYLRFSLIVHKNKKAHQCFNAAGICSPTFPSQYNPRPTCVFFF